GVRFGGPLAYSMSLDRGAPKYMEGRSSGTRVGLGPFAREFKAGAERRVIGEPYRQAFGRDRTLRYGRPAGWMLMMSAVEKVFFPAALVIMMLFRNWQGLAVTI